MHICLHECLCARKDINTRLTHTTRAATWLMGRCRCGAQGIRWHIYVSEPFCSVPAIFQLRNMSSGTSLFAALGLLGLLRLEEFFRALCHGSPTHGQAMVAGRPPRNLQVCAELYQLDCLQGSAANLVRDKRM